MVSSFLFTLLFDSWLFDSWLFNFWLFDSWLFSISNEYTGGLHDSTGYPLGGTQGGGALGVREIFTLGYKLSKLDSTSG